MDYLVDAAKKMRGWLRKVSLKRAMMCYVSVGLAGGFCGAFFVIRFIHVWKEMVGNLAAPPDASRIFNYLTVLQGALLVGIFLMCVLGVCHLFYQNRLETGLGKIKMEIRHLRREDISYDCSYEGTDEIALACQGLNEMRLQLISDRRRIWELMEQQRLVNAAFAHDIRTPLTVMKGYLQTLERFYPTGNISEEKLMEQFHILSEQVGRMEAFADIMKRLNQIEEWTPSYRKVEGRDLAKKIQANMAGMLEGRTIRGEMKTEGEWEREMVCDLSMILEVADNLLGNALRYAETYILLTMEVSGEELFLYVQDDGEGFSGESLEKGSRPWFSTEKDRMGMGLSICKLLCKKHGGDLELANSIDGGGIACAIFHLFEKLGKS